MKHSLNFILLLSTLLATVLSAPNPSPQKERREGESPLAAIGNFIQRLQTSFAEGTASIGQPAGNNAFSLPLTAPSTTTTTTTTSAPTTTTRRTTNAFDSINAILDNISRSGPNSNRIDDNNDKTQNKIFGNVPGRNLDLPPLTTQRPFFSPTTSRPPFSLDGINQGINAFFQAFIKTNIDKIFRPGQDQQKRQIESRDDQPTRPPSLGDLFNNLFRKQ